MALLSLSAMAAVPNIQQSYNAEKTRGGDDALRRLDGRILAAVVNVADAFRSTHSAYDSSRVSAMNELPTEVRDFRRAANGYLGGQPVRFTPGTVLANRYRIVAPLGRGGMGEVYRADGWLEHDGPHRPCGARPAMDGRPTAATTAMTFHGRSRHSNRVMANLPRKVADFTREVPELHG